MTIPSYPLQWPAGWGRSSTQVHGKFRTGKSGYRDGSGWQSAKDITIDKAARRVREELGRMGLSSNDVVISTNLKLRLDGLPRSDQREPSDSGVAVYWIDRSGATRCMAIDRYVRVADNLAAVAATLDAMRAIERHGGAEILDRAFTGFAALPPPNRRHWHEVLGCPAHASTDHVRRNYRRARSLFHPDKGGDADQFHEISAAWETFCAERGLNAGETL